MIDASTSVQGHLLLKNKVISLFSPETIFDLWLAKQVVADLEKLTEKTSYPILFDLRNITAMNREAIDYLHSSFIFQHMEEKAFLIENKPSQLFYNLLLSKASFPASFYSVSCPKEIRDWFHRLHQSSNKQKTA